MNADWIKETQGICIDGVNTAVRPSLIGPNQLSWMMNGSVRDGKPKTRPALVERLVLPTGKVQGAGYFSRDEGIGILSIGGHIYRMLISGNTFSTDEIPLAFQNSSLRPMAWMQETVGNFLIQDDESACIIFDGATARRADPAKNEVPVGSMMAYGNGRLFVVVDEFNVQAGNITDQSIFNSELYFTETTYLFGGGAFYYPRKLTGLGFLPTNNTASGLGSLMVFGRRRTDSLRAEVASRDLWQIIPGFQVVVLDGIGAVSHLSITRVNQDLYWRDGEGQIRSLRSASFDASSPGNAPQSREVARIVDYETDNWLDQCNGMYFDNRLFFTAAPFLHKSGCVAFGKLISLDCAPLATMRGKAPPAYDGEWTGLNFVRMFTGEFAGINRAFAISSDDDGNNRLWEIMPDGQDDIYLSGSTPVAVPIKTYAEFRAFDFGNPTQLKQITRCDIYPTDIEGDVTVWLQYRVGNRTQWLDVDSVEFCAKMTDASTDAPHVWKNLYAQERGRVKSFSFPDDIDPILKMAQTVGYTFQIRLIWTGKVLIDRIDIWARPLKQTQFSNIPDLDTDCVENNVQNNEISYAILP